MMQETLGADYRVETIAYATKRVPARGIHVLHLSRTAYLEGESARSTESVV